jgi:hypothetical protein
MFDLLAVSDVVWQALIAAVVTLVLSAMAHRAASKAATAAKAAEGAAKAAEAKADTAAVKVEEVKTTLAADKASSDAKLGGLAEVTGKIHVLTNSNMAAQLKISSVALKRVAELTKHPDDVAAFQLADKLLREHEGKQAVVDSNERKEL